MIRHPKPVFHPAVQPNSVFAQYISPKYRSIEEYVHSEVLRYLYSYGVETFNDVLELPILCVYQLASRLLFGTVAMVPHHQVDGSQYEITEYDLSDYFFAEIKTPECRMFLGGMIHRSEELVEAAIDDQTSYSALLDIFMTYTLLYPTPLIDSLCVVLRSHGFIAQNRHYPSMKLISHNE